MSITRRSFVTQAAASVGLVCLGSLTQDLIAQAHKHAKATPASFDHRAFRFFTAEQAADYEAFAEQIIPTDDTPGAKEANVVAFTDYALREIEPQNKTDFVAALDALTAQTKKMAPGATSFAALTSAQQAAVMKAMEKSNEFGLLRAYTVIGFFCDPADGGNKDKVGWKLIGFEDKFYYQPPFGYYDARGNEAKS